MKRVVLPQGIATQDLDMTDDPLVVMEQTRSKLLEHSVARFREGHNLYVITVSSQRFHTSSGTLG